MKRIALYSIAIGLLMTGCRQQSDELLSFGQNDNQAFASATGSFANEFQAFWLAMNENYCIWDYEQQCGLDWDEVLTTYLPKFEELDKREELVTDKELRELYCQFMDSLHDGHMYVSIFNGQTGKYVTINPCSDRNQRERGKRYGDEKDNITTPDVYRTSQVDAHYQIRDYDATGAAIILVEQLDTVANRIIRAADAYVAAVDAAGGANSLNDSIYSGAKKIKKYALSVINALHSGTMADVENNISSIVSQYNASCKVYTFMAQQLGVEMPQMDAKVADDPLKSLRYALFEGNIAYLRIGAFRLTPHLTANIKSDDTSMFAAYQRAVNRVWHHWFDTIQSLHASGQLGGVVIDVRNNGGGWINDYQYALGALLPSGGLHSHTMRVKNGIGRLDYAPLTPFYFPTYSGEHAIISSEPIVVLANSNSGSLAENTTWGVQLQPNGHFVGTRTYGALNALNADPEYYSDAYTGAFGVKNKTTFYGFLPKYVCLYGDELRVRESHGFDPDEDVPLDVDLWKNSGRDNQLERALDYIHNR